MLTVGSNFFLQHVLSILINGHRILLILISILRNRSPGRSVCIMYTRNVKSLERINRKKLFYFLNYDFIIRLHLKKLGCSKINTLLVQQRLQESYMIHAATKTGCRVNVSLSGIEITARKSLLMRALKSSLGISFRTKFARFVFHRRSLCRR